MRSGFSTLLLFAGLTASAAEVQRFDFGTPGSRLASGHVRVTGRDGYNDAVGYGWESTGQVDFTTQTPKWDDLDPMSHMGRGITLERPLLYNQYVSPVRRDGVHSHSDMLFRIDVPDGKYRIRITLGDLTEGLDSMNVDCNGHVVTKNISAKHMAWRNYPVFFGFYRDVCFTAEATDGAIRIRLYGDDAQYKRLRARFDELFPHDERGRQLYPRVSFWNHLDTTREIPFDPRAPHKWNSVLGLTLVPYAEPPFNWSGSTLRSSGARWKQSGSFIDHVNNRRFDAAAELLAAADPNDPQLDLAAGYLCLLGHPDAPATNEIAWMDRAEALLNQAPPTSAATELAEDLETFRQAQTRFVNRGMRQEYDPIDERVSEESHFLQNGRVVELMKQIPTDSLLYPKTLQYAARAGLMLDPHRWAFSGGEGLNLFRRLRTEWPDNRYARYFLDNTWEMDEDWHYGDYTSDIDVTGAPKWAIKLRQAYLTLTDMCEWWHDNKLQPDGGIGGGWGDDVELIGLFALFGIVTPDHSAKTMRVADACLEGLWTNSEVDPVAGFCRPVWDAEHSAEWTGNTTSLIMMMRYGHPIWVERSMKTAKLMRTLWMGHTKLGRLHFRSNYLGALNVGNADQANDGHINFRAARSALTTHWYNASPVVERIFVEWADAWLADAMSEARGKPRGVIPTSVGFPDNTLGGVNSPSWYENAHPHGTVNYDFAVLDPARAGRGGLSSGSLSYRSYIVELLVLAHAFTGKEKYLEPLKLEAEITQRYLNNPPDDLVPGSEAWAGHILAGNNNNSYNAIKTWQQVQSRLAGAESETTGFTPAKVIDICDNIIENCALKWPRLTTETSATDRIAFNTIAFPYLIMSGDGPGLSNLIRNLGATYRGLGRNAVAMVESSNRRRIKIRLQNFNRHAIDVRVRLWRLEAGGTYEVTQGVDRNGDGSIDAASSTSVHNQQHRGSEIVISLAPRKTTILEITQTRSGQRVERPADLAIVPEELVYNLKWRELEATVHNIGSRAAENAEVVFSEIGSDGTVREIGRARIAHLNWPLDLDPKTVRVGVAYKPKVAKARIRVQLDPGGTIDEITETNNVIEKELEFDLRKIPGRVGPDNV